MVIKMSIQEAWRSPEALFSLLGEGKPVIIVAESDTLLLRGERVMYASVNDEYITIGFGGGFEVLLTKKDYRLYQY